MSEQSQFCQPITHEELGTNYLDWTGNDDSARNHHGIVRQRRGSVGLRLCWKASKESQSRFIGCFRLSIGELLSEGFIRPDPKPGYVRVRVSHASDNALYLQANSKGPRILLGRFF